MFKLRSIIEVDFLNFMFKLRSILEVDFLHNVLLFKPRNILHFNKSQEV